MTESHLQALVGSQFHGLADALEEAGRQIATAPSLCQGWTVANVVAHMTMAARYDQARFGAELAAAGYRFDVLSNTIARRDGALPFQLLLDDLRSDVMAAWTPPGGGAMGALTHVVIHGLDITAANRLARTTSDEAAEIVLTALGEGSSAHFGVDPSGLHLHATDLDWHHGHGSLLEATAQDLILALAGRPRAGLELRRSAPN